MYIFIISTFYNFFTYRIRDFCILNSILKTAHSQMEQSLGDGENNNLQKDKESLIFTLLMRER